MALVTLTYPALSAFVGAAQIVDGVLLYRRSGKFTRGMLYFSLFEYVWAIVSVGELVDDESPTPAWLPLSFIAWIVFGFVWGVTLGVRGKPEVIPVPGTIVGGVFGCYFLVASLWVFAVAR